MEFAHWLEQHGCTVEVTQEDDGGGYVCLEVTLPHDGSLAPPTKVDVTVTT